MSKTEFWDNKDLPSLEKLKVHILPGPSHGLVTSLFCRAGAKRAAAIEDADLVVFLGGSDVSPYLYGQKACPEVTYCDQARDKREKDVYDICSRKGIPMFGICRGAQFLHVMNEGTLWQHVDNHTGHHLIFDVDAGVALRSSSTHHQMMEYNDTMTLVAVTNEPVASFVKNDETLINVDQGFIEVEACVYEDSKCFCVQGHPEYGPPEFTSWSFHKLYDLLKVDFELTPKKETV